MSFLGAYLASHALFIVGVATWVIMLSRVSAAQRTPQSTFAWLLAFALLPLVSIPLYIAFGSRKFPSRAKSGQLQLPPIRPGNSFELLPTGELAFERLLSLLRSAERTIDLTVFILGNDETGRAIVSALCERARGGISVRVILDAIGSIESHREAARRLREVGAEVRLFMPFRHSPVRGRTNLRSHRKIVILDESTVLAGGMNFASEYMGPPLAEGAPPRWRDVAAVLRGPSVSDACALFESDWAYCGGGPRPSSASPPNTGDVGHEHVQFVPSGPDMATDTMYDHFLNGIYRARERIVIVTPYYVPDQALQHALVLSARRGVATELLVPAWSNHRVADLARRGYVRELIKSGVRLHYYTKGMVHAKAMVIDDSFAYVGSPNFDMRSLLLNYEDAICVYSPEAIAQIRGYADRLIAECATEAPTFPHRPMTEQLARLLAPEL